MQWGDWLEQALAGTADGAGPSGGCGILGNRKGAIGKAMYEKQVLDHTDALAIVEAMMEAAPRVTERPLALAVVDDRGELMAFALMDGGTHFARHYATRKAYTASRMRADLRDFAAQRGAQGRSVTDYGDPGLVASARGGVAILAGDGSVVGGVGVSGASPDEDEEIARLGLQAAGP